MVKILRNTVMMKNLAKNTIQSQRMMYEIYHSPKVCIDLDSTDEDQEHQ